MTFKEIKVLEDERLVFMQSEEGSKWQGKVMRLALRLIKSLAHLCHCTLIYLNDKESK